MDARTIAERLFAKLVEGEASQFDLYDKQRVFVHAEERRVAFIAGIGSGKSWAGCVRALRAAEGRIGQRAITTPNLGIITAPTYPMLRDATLRTFMDIAGERVVSFNKSEMLVVLRNGSEIIFRSTDHPERLRGPSISWWYGDEAALYHDRVWKIMIGRLRQFGKPGAAWITTTPRGRNWVYKEFKDERPGYRMVRAASRENVYLDESIVQEWASEYVGDFARQELEGQFVAFEGLIYPEFSVDQHVSRERPGEFRQVVAGVDWGFANPGVILVCGVDGDGRMFVLAEQYARQRRVEEWADVGAQMRDIWGVERFLCDPSEPDYIKIFQERGLKAEAADNSVLPGIQVVKNRLALTPALTPSPSPTGEGDRRARLVVSPDCVNLIGEMEQYQWATNTHGVKDAPVKANDHAMDALRYAIMGVDKPKVRKLTVRTQKYA